MTFICIFYDMEKEISREEVEAPDSQKASDIIYTKYNGNLPGPCMSISVKGGSYGESYMRHNRW